MSHHAEIDPCPADYAGLQSRFRDFDAKDVYNHVKAYCCSAQARNFVVEFGPTHSRIAWDLNLAHIKALLSETHQPAAGEAETVRWMSVTFVPATLLLLGP